MRIEGPNPTIVDGLDLATDRKSVSAGGPVGEGFASVLGETVRAEKVAEEQAMRFAAGDPNVGIHDVVIDAEKASLMVRFAVTLKNRAIEAYRELMSTPV